MTDNIDLTEDRWFPCGWGLVYRYVCVPKSWTDSRISEEVTRDDPPGTSANEWVVTGQPTWADHEPEMPCPDCDHRRHVLLNC